MTLLRLHNAIAAFAMLFIAPSVLQAANCITGTVSFQGTVTLTGVTHLSVTDLSVTPKNSAEGTKGGEKCDVHSVTADVPDGGGQYGDDTPVSINLTLRKGGSCGGSDIAPTGSCVLTIEAKGTDPVNDEMARGSATVFVTAAEIGGNATITPVNITASKVKASAGWADGVADECVKWTRRQLKRRVACNFKLLKLGSAGETRCKDGCTMSSTNQTSPCEPLFCDDGNIVEKILAFAHDSNNQQTDPTNATKISDFTDPTLRIPAICQKKLGKVAANYVIKRNTLVQTECIDTNNDTETCRQDQSREAAMKLDPIGSMSCDAQQVTDGGSGKLLPDVEDPCSSKCMTGGTIDDKCMKSCFRLVLDAYSDLLIGEIAECGNGIQQTGEACDDGNASDTDCCSTTCAVTGSSPGTEGPITDPSCADGSDNDCDELTDGDDPDCS